MTIRLPYDKTHIEMEIADTRVLAVLEPSVPAPAQSQEALVQNALENPVRSPRLRDLAAGKRRVLVITSDHTRPVPSKITLPPLLREIRAGNPDAEIKIVIATGLHRAMTESEMADKFGAGLMAGETFINHDGYDTAHMAFKGILPSGGELWLNHTVDWADLVVAEGFIEPHFFAGFSGGRKSVLPGIASEKTVLANHCAAFISHPRAKTGNLDGNPIHADMLFAAKAARLAFILNVTLDFEKRITAAFAGDSEAAHRAGCACMARQSKVSATPADIVIASNGGYPLDQNIYQAVKGMTAAEATVKKDGVIIQIAKSNDGHGAPEFHKTFAEEKNLDRMLDTFMKTPKESTRIDQWESQILARVLKHARVIYISDAPDEMVRDFHMIPAHSIDEAVKMAEDILGNHDASITVIPDGISVVVG